MHSHNTHMHYYFMHGPGLSRRSSFQYWETTEDTSTSCRSGLVPTAFPPSSHLPAFTLVSADSFWIPCASEAGWIQVILNSSVSTGCQQGTAGSWDRGHRDAQSISNTAVLPQKVHTDWTCNSHWPFGVYVLQLPDQERQRENSPRIDLPRKCYTS